MESYFRSAKRVKINENGLGCEFFRKRNRSRVGDDWRSGFVVGGKCVVEFEDGPGAILRVHLRGSDVPDLVALGRSFWSGE